MSKKPRRPTFQDIVAQVKVNSEAGSYDRLQEMLSRPTHEKALSEIKDLASHFYEGSPDYRQGNSRDTGIGRELDTALAAALSSGTREDWGKVRVTYLKRKKIGSVKGGMGCDPTSQLAMAAAMPCLAGTHEGLPYLRTVRSVPIYRSLESISPLLYRHLQNHYGHEANYQTHASSRERKEQSNGGIRRIL